MPLTFEFASILDVLQWGADYGVRVIAQTPEGRPLSSKINSGLDNCDTDSTAAVLTNSLSLTVLI